MTLQSQCLGHAKTIVFRANKDAPKSPLKNCDHKSKKAGRTISQRTGVSIPQKAIYIPLVENAGIRQIALFCCSGKCHPGLNYQGRCSAAQICFLFSQIAHVNMNTILKAQHKIVTHNLESSLCQKYSKKFMLAIQTKTVQFDKTAESSTVVHYNRKEMTIRILCRVRKSNLKIFRKKKTEFFHLL